MMQSAYTIPNDNRVFPPQSIRPRANGPLGGRWSGWFVSGTHEKQQHLGNLTEDLVHLIGVAIRDACSFAVAVCFEERADAVKTIESGGFNDSYASTVIGKLDFDSSELLPATECFADVRNASRGRSLVLRAQRIYEWSVFYSSSLA